MILSSPQLPCSLTGSQGDERISSGGSLITRVTRCSARRGSAARQAWECSWGRDRRRGGETIAKDGKETDKERTVTDVCDGKKNDKERSVTDIDDNEIQNKNSGDDATLHRVPVPAAQIPHGSPSLHGASMKQYLETRTRNALYRGAFEHPGPRAARWSSHTEQSPMCMVRGRVIGY